MFENLNAKPAPDFRRNAGRKSTEIPQPVRDIARQSLDNEIALTVRVTHDEAAQLVKFLMLECKRNGWGIDKRVNEATKTLSDVTFKVRKESQKRKSVNTESDD